MKMNKFTLKSLFTAVSAVITLFATNVMAGQPHPWQMNFQEPASPMMERLVHLHNGLLVMCVVVSLFVLGLLIYVAYRFRESKNPVPSKTTHNTLIEVIWTVIPILILVAIVIPSWRLIHFMDKTDKAEITLKAIGYQWYWGYEYMDGEGKGIAFESFMKVNDPKAAPELQLKEGEPRNLAVDNEIVLPINTNVRLLTTAADVIHAFAVPAFGVKIDAVPGKLNESWFTITKEGDYYGQCSELCGSKHAFMPIHVKAVSKEAYAEWVAAKYKQLNITPEVQAKEEAALKADEGKTNKR